MKNKTLPQIFIIYLRYLLGFAFVYASIVKIQGLRFTSESGALNPINSAWHFFETMYQSGIYWKFLGYGQLIAGFLLMTQRYAKLGVILFLPIILNIFVITISYDFKGTPIITGLILVTTFILIAWDWNTLKILINKTPTFSTKPRLENDFIWSIIGVIFFFLTIISKLIISKNSFILIFLSFLTISLLGMIIGYRKQKKITNKS
ncbi:hypothetical protein DS884_00260 [Tenacibaculum sp. E3R01]|uniref:hypothetical protein n=1 Tax=Tenacibaculum sp. E3R01 TaxID=2267227 RepID=UPI000DE91399|nr:hypothetical protein [Tenacibaculum sp. E3R01]RBW63139.1 hypothetical protein DS884_00260 [Tenacibaculum sp. E3R01]